jgi:hypothetical protein
MQILRESLESLEIGTASSFGELTSFPLLGGAERRPDYATLDEAIEQGWLEVREVSAGGSVPELTVANKGDRAVFMLDGEELIGAKQNRVLNLTILAPAGKTLVIPVSCVEQGRWARQSPVMSTSRDTLYAKARLAKMASVSRSYGRRGQAVSDQSALWHAIADKAAGLGVASPTGAMSDIFREHNRRVSDYEHAFQAVEGQCGAIFAIGGRLVGLELFEHPDVLRRMLRKIVRSYALDAIQAAESESMPTVEAAAAFTDEVAQGRIESFPAVGLGEDIRISGPQVTGAALVADDRVVHLCAFRTDDGPQDDGSRSSRQARILRASDRRR